MFRYGFEGMIYAQYENNPLEFNGQTKELIGTTYNFEVLFALLRFLSL